jgi:DGQHR domain-containing protein
MTEVPSRTSLELRLPALRVCQGEKSIFLFGVDGKLLPTFAAISRIHRDELQLMGYQRPEVTSHVRAIRRYLESDGALLPNAIVLAFDDRVRFEESPSTSASDYSVPGTLVIPQDPDGEDDEKTAWVVDGQQRTAAIRDADVDTFPVGVVGFVATGAKEQRSQFILVNSTKPLPKGLIHELLPETTGKLPDTYARRKLPAYLIGRLNTESDSPFRGAIATPTMKDGYITDNSVLRMIEHSIYEGALYQYRDPASGDADEEQMLLHLKVVWSLVEATWREEWKLPPRKSRLTHGAGIQAMGYVLDTLTGDVAAPELLGLELDRALRPLRAVCAWTSGTWDFGPDDVRKWNQIQNTPNDRQVLTRYLLSQLPARGLGRPDRRGRWSQPRLGEAE